MYLTSFSEAEMKCWSSSLSNIRSSGTRKNPCTPYLYVERVRRPSFTAILLEKFRFDQVQDLMGCVAGGCGGAVDPEVRIARRFVGRLESR